MLKAADMKVNLKRQKTSLELVEEFVQFKPSKEYAKIANKPTGLMDQHEMQLEQLHLTEKLKQYNAFLSRLVQKHLTKAAVEEGKARGSRKGLIKKSDDPVEETLLLDSKLRNVKKLER